MPTDTQTRPLPAGRQRRSTSQAQALEAAEKATRGLPKVGRPLTYHPDLCERAVALGMKGKSWAGIAREFNVSRKTINEWEGLYPEFSDALSRARAGSQAWWEEHGQKNLKAKHYQAQVARTIMAAQFSDYREAGQKVEVTFDLGQAVIDAIGRKPSVPGDDAKVIDATPGKGDASSER